jgi:small-conductance mechanosensitive channel
MTQFLRDTFGFIYAPVLIPLIRIAGILSFGFIALKVVDSAIRRVRLLIPAAEAMGSHRVEQRAETLRHIVRSVVKGLLIVVVMVTIISELGVDIGPILASAGIAGLAIGFGAQSLVKDVISGFFILFEDQYGVGDVVKIGDLSGVVERMTLRVTVLRNLEGQVPVIPNGNIQTVTVMTKEWARAVVDVTVSLKEDLSNVFLVLNRISLRLAQDMPNEILDKPTLLGVEKLDDIARNIEGLIKSLASPKNSLLEKLKVLPQLGEIASWMPKKIRGRGACQEVVMAQPDITKLPVITCWPGVRDDSTSCPMAFCLMFSISCLTTLK